MYIFFFLVTSVGISICLYCVFAADPVTTMVYACDMCHYDSETFFEFRNHYIRRHQNDPNFHVRCCIGACGYSTKKWSSFRVHLHRIHKQIVQNERVIPEGMPLANAPNDNHGNAVPEPVQSGYYNLMFGLSLEVIHNVSSVACDQIIASTSVVLKHHTNAIRSKVRDELLQRNIDPSFLEQMEYYDDLLDEIAV